MTRFDKLISGVARFLLEDVPYRSYVGIIAYSTRAQEVVNMTEIVNESWRKWLVGILPRHLAPMAPKSTATGKGLLKGLEVTNFVNNQY